MVRIEYFKNDYSQEEISLLVMFIVLWILIISFAILITYLKMFKRKCDLLTLKATLSEENRKLITDNDDLDYLEKMVEKFEWYTKKWYYNNTISFYWRYKKILKIIKKYELDIRLF